MACSIRELDRVNTYLVGFPWHEIQFQTRSLEAFDHLKLVLWIPPWHIWTLSLPTFYPSMFRNHLRDHCHRLQVRAPWSDCLPTYSTAHQITCPWHCNARIVYFLTQRHNIPYHRMLFVYCFPCPHSIPSRTEERRSSCPSVLLHRKLPIRWPHVMFQSHRPYFLTSDLLLHPPYLWRGPKIRSRVPLFPVVGQKIQRCQFVSRSKLSRGRRGISVVMGNKGGQRFWLRFWWWIHLKDKLLPQRISRYQPTDLSMATSCSSCCWAFASSSAARDFLKKLTKERGREKRDDILSFLAPHLIIRKYQSTLTVC